MLSVQDHPIVQAIDSEIALRKQGLLELQCRRLTLIKSLLKCKCEYAIILCRNLNIQLKGNSVAILCGYELLTNQQMVEQWLLERLVSINQCQFTCSLSDLQNKLLMRLNSHQQDFSFY
ncbi:hypothetical protein GCM10007916_00070 [Psychromonas marina]|uniref:Type III secretion system apparatus protein n=1 Tax=Psychromonas marina TaxID=88364 RepID=A0ABQ6DVD8_9GAMM|nr:hypothetical protein GCM10007916_00070 [Psychromonas marina]